MLKVLKLHSDVEMVCYNLSKCILRILWRLNERQELVPVAVRSLGVGGSWGSPLCLPILFAVKSFVLLDH